ncbi:MAG: flavodoxin domain-containing protein [Candidatus Humimicrobiaceae bacterium]
MNILIAYASQYGSTEKCALKLSELLSEKADILNLNKDKNADISKYDAVIIGSHIMAGKINKKIKKFYENNLNELFNKKVGVFICAGNTELAQKEIEDNFPPELLNKAVAVGYFGYEYNLEKMNFLLKSIIKKIAKITQSCSNILEDNIKEFAGNF